jgi:hypothetical protein
MKPLRHWKVPLLRAICSDTGLCCIIEVRKDTPKSSARRSARTSRRRCQVRRRPRLRRGRFRSQALRRLASRGETPRLKEHPSSRPKLDEGARNLLETDLEERPPLRCCTVAAQGVETDCNSPAPSPHSTCKLGIFREAAGPGFEPGLSDSESLVLPLHHPARQRRIL